MMRLLSAKTSTHQRHRWLFVALSHSGDTGSWETRHFCCSDNRCSLLASGDGSGNTGKIMRGIPRVVIPTLLFSLVESLLVLPCHLSHRAPAPFHGNGAGLRSFWGKLQGAFTSRLEDFVHRTYRPFLQVAIEWRYVTLACGLGVFLLTLGLMGAGCASSFFRRWKEIMSLPF